MLLIWKEQWLWRGIAAPYQTARLKATQEQWEPRRAPQALSELPPGARAEPGLQGPRSLPCAAGSAGSPAAGGSQGDCLILKRPNTQQKQAARSGAEPAVAQDGPAHAEETLGCGGCAGGGCACEVLLGAACWLESWDNWSLLERDFNSAFSRSSKEFLSTNSFICSFRTSTSSLTAYIKWLFTRSCKEQVDSYTTGLNKFPCSAPELTDFTAVSLGKKALITKNLWINQPLSTNNLALMWSGPDMKSFVSSTPVTSVPWKPRRRTMPQLLRKAPALMLWPGGMCLWYTGPVTEACENQINKKAFTPSEAKIQQL